MLRAALRQCGSGEADSQDRSWLRVSRAALEMSSQPASLPSLDFAVVLRHPTRYGCCGGSTGQGLRSAEHEAPAERQIERATADGSLTVGVVGSKLGLAVSVSGQARAQERRRKSPPTRRRFFPPVVLRPPGCFGCCAWRRGKTPQINTVTVSGFLREEWGRFNHSGRPPLTDTTARPRAPQPRPRNLGYR